MHEDWGENEKTDAGKTGQTADAGTSDSDSGAAACVPGATDPVTDPGLSCTTGGSFPTCIHYVGSEWTLADVTAACETGASRASGKACVYEEGAFCERTGDSACLAMDEGKSYYIFGLTAQLCAGAVMGTPIPKPASGWPASYSDLVPPDASAEEATDAGADGG